jgi:hypothetical protein
MCIRASGVAPDRFDYLSLTDDLCELIEGIPGRFPRFFVAEEIVDYFKHF